MASVASQLIEEVTAHAQCDSLEHAREICADGTYFPNNLRINKLRIPGRPLRKLYSYEVICDVIIVRWILLQNTQHQIVFRSRKKKNKQQGNIRYFVKTLVRLLP